MIQHLITYNGEIIKCSVENIVSIGKLNYHNFSHAEEEYTLACRNAVET